MELAKELSEIRATVEKAQTFHRYRDLQATIENGTLSGQEEFSSLTRELENTLIKLDAILLDARIEDIDAVFAN